MTIRSVTFMVFSFFCLSDLRAGSGSSAYSILGIGDIRYSTSARSMGMGYTGIALPGSNYVNGHFPATWARINRTRVEAGFWYEGFKSSDGLTSLYRASGDFGGVALAIPISTDNGIVFVGGFSPYSTVNYHTYTRGTQGGASYTLSHEGNGGINKAQAGLSYSPFQDFSLGASLDYLFGSIDRKRTLTFASSSFTGGVVTEAMTAHGIVTTVGGLYTGLGGLAEPLQPLSIGFTISSHGALKSNRQLVYDFSREQDSSAAIKSSISIPLAYGFGIAYQSGERYLLTADYFTQRWGRADFNGVDPREIRNSYRFGVGGERIASRDVTESWWERVSYRLGFTYHATYYRANGEPITEWAVTGGLALPFSGDTRLNVAIEYGQRGTTKNHLVRDNIVRAVVSLNLSEPWFVRYEEE